MWVAAEAGPWVEAHPRVPDSIVTYALLVWAAAASSVTYWAGRRHRISSRRAIRSLRRGSPRRSENSTGRRQGGALGGGPPEGPHRN